jgi:hypothetical protein
MATEKTESEIDKHVTREALAKSRAGDQKLREVEERELEINGDYDSQKS